MHATPGAIGALLPALETIIARQVLNGLMPAVGGARSTTAADEEALDAIVERLRKASPDAATLRRVLETGLPAVPTCFACCLEIAGPEFVSWLSALAGAARRYVVERVARGAG